MVGKATGTEAPARPLMHLHALGPLRAAAVDDAAHELTQPRRLALLCYLALASPRGLHARDTLVSLLWPEAAQEQGRRSLRNALHALRKTFGAGLLRTAGKELVGLAPGALTCDVHELEAQADDGRALEALRAFREVASGFHVDAAAGFDEWLSTTRAALRARLLRSARHAADAASASGDQERVTQLLRAAHETDPDDEVLLRELMSTMSARGDVAEASRVYRAHAARRAEDDGGFPSPETTALMTRLTTDNGRHGAHGDTIVAVLPVVAQEGTDEADLANALTEGVMRRLTRARGVRVCARGVVSSLHRPGHSPLDAGRQLGAQLVVDARLGAAAGTADLEVRMEVISVADGTIVREATLRAARNRLFWLEGAMASTVLPGMQEAASTRRPDRADGEPTRDVEAYVLYVRGTHLFLRAAHVGGRAQDLHDARECFERAVARDPEFGHAYAGLSNYYAVCAARNLLRPFAEHFGHAIALSHRALALDPGLAIPHVHLGVQAMYLECDWPRAGREFGTAAALDPSYAEARRFLGVHHLALGEAAEGLRELAEAVRLEPSIPLFLNSLADALLSLGRADEALPHLRKALQLDPGYRAATDRLLRCLEASGDHAGAIEVRRALGAAGDVEAFARALQADGPRGYRRERARELRALIDRLAPTAGTDSGNAGDLFNPVELRIALAHAELGEWDEVAAWEERAATAHPGRRQWFRARPELQRPR